MERGPLSEAAGRAEAATPPLAALVDGAFAIGGALARADPGYRPRAAQQTLARAIAATLESRATLVAEAGTGVGKTFAYLVPLLLSGARALVSTATKALQDQLFGRDLPILQRALGVPLRAALLKGRASYLCLQRQKQARALVDAPEPHLLRALARIEAWAPSTRSGDLAELAGLDERSPVIPLVSSTRENCLGAECPEWRACHVMRARREAMAADLVVVNHHLFFADLALRDGGVAELLPTVDAAVFDEAHRLVETGVQFQGVALGSAAALDFARDLLAAGRSHARGLGPWTELHADVEQRARELRLASAGALREARAAAKLRWDERAEALAPPLAALAATLERCQGALAAVAGSAPEFVRLAERAAEQRRLADLFARPPAVAGRVRWIEVSARHVRLVESPLDIRALLAEQRRAAPKAWIFTSATLGNDARLGWFTDATGLDDAAVLQLASPFDYATNARIWVPRRLPQPNGPAHAPAVGALAARLAARLGGRTFVLTTTLRALPAIAEALRAAAAAAGAPLDVLVQGSESRRVLLERYGDGCGRVLVGSQSFWEGIDFPGAALQCVLIDKLPFPPPHDPLVEARVRLLHAQGRNPFVEYFIAEATIALKQGAGRLIRSETDRGLLVVCDSRLATGSYGSRMLAALPPMRRLADETEALGWLDELGAAGETVDRVTTVATSAGREPRSRAQ